MLKRIAIGNVWLILMMGLSMPLWVSAEVATPEEALKVERQGDISYISGGVGEQEQQAIKNLGRNFNLKLVMAIEAGNYLSGAQVIIQDAEGNTVLQAVSEGPFFYAELPPGTYTVEASGFGDSYQKTATLTGQNQVQLDFYWPNTVANENPKTE
jgi:hypothetical protein